MDEPRAPLLINFVEDALIDLVPNLKCEFYGHYMRPYGDDTVYVVIHCRYDCGKLNLHDMSQRPVRACVSVWFDDNGEMLGYVPLLDHRREDSESSDNYIGDMWIGRIGNIANPNAAEEIRGLIKYHGASA